MVGVGAWWFSRGDAPDRVSLDNAAAQISTTVSLPATSSATGASSTTLTATTAVAAESTSVPADALAGTWQIDTSIGRFAIDNATGTFVGFRIQEELAAVGKITAVGRTPKVSGQLVIDGDRVTEVVVEADMRAIVTEDRRRDDNVQDALETSKFPTATFVLTEPLALPAGAAADADLQFAAQGDLTIHGVTRPVTFPLQARFVDGTIVVVGSLDVSFADYGVRVPSARIVVSADDHGPIELQLFFTRRT